MTRLLRQKQFEAAETVCRKRIKRSPRNAEYHYWLGRTLWRQEQFDEAVKELRVAIGLRKATLSADRIDLIRVLLEARRYEEVLKECEHLTDPRFHKISGVFKKMHEYAAYEAKYQAYVGLRRYREAKEILKLLLPYQRGKGRDQLLHNIKVCEEFLVREDIEGPD